MTTDNSSASRQNAHGLYRTIWRWHFYAGLFCLPFVLTLALSGAVYLFKPQIDAWVDRSYHDLRVSGERVSPNEQIAVALAAVPNSDFLNYQLPETASHAAVISVSRQEERVLAYVNPYTLNVMKVIGYEEQFIRQIRTFHGELLSGNVGSVLVEFAGCWAIVLIISGLYLWWPRQARGLAGVLYPRLNQGKRLFWRDLHAVTGIWVSGFALFLLVTALPWTLVWGSAFQELRALGTPDLQQDWSLGRAHEHAMHTEPRSEYFNLSPALLASAQSLNFAPPVELSASPEEPGVWHLQSQHQNRPLRSEAWLGESGEVLRTKTFAERPLIDRAIGIGTAAHEGQLFGWFNQLLGVLTAACLATMSISGFILWRKRKPQGKLGAPAAMPNVNVGKGVALIVLALALFLPLLAASLIALFLLEWLVLRHLPPLQTWLGIRA